MVHQLCARPDGELKELTEYLKELGATVTMTEEELATRKDNIKEVMPVN